MGFHAPVTSRRGEELSFTILFFARIGDEDAGGIVFAGD
jgi:hypothetical protein